MDASIEPSPASLVAKFAYMESKVHAGTAPTMYDRGYNYQATEMSYALVYERTVVTDDDDDDEDGFTWKEWVAIGVSAGVLVGLVTIICTVIVRARFYMTNPLVTVPTTKILACCRFQIDLPK